MTSEQADAEVGQEDVEPVLSTADDASSDDATDGEADDQPKRGPLATLVRESAIVLVSALVISLVLKTFLIQPFFIPSISMESTLDVGDRIIVNKLAPGPFDLERGDVVVFVDPGGWLNPAQAPKLNPVQHFLTWIGLLPANAGEHLVKRVIGLPGDHVVCCNVDGLVTVNGEPIQETYLNSGAIPSEIPFDVVVPEGNLWVMGDNRQSSADSRYNMQTNGGFVPIDNVVGRVVVIVWPISHLEYLDRPDSVFQDVPDP